MPFMLEARGGSWGGGSGGEGIISQFASVSAMCNGK